MRFDVHNFDELKNAVYELQHESVEAKTIVLFDGLEPSRFQFESDKVVHQACDERGMALGY